MGTRPKLTAIDLFSGCGGMTLGLRQAGFRVIAAVDSDGLSMQTYRVNHRGVKTWQSDIRKLPALRLQNALGIGRGDLDLLAGCPPCQGFSSMRTMNGGKRIRDPQQKDLVFEFLRFVRQLKPKVVMMENVPSLAKDGRIRILVRQLRMLGYKCHVAVLNAADYGVPQRRRRFILLGGLNQEIEFAAPTLCQKTVRHAFANLKPPGQSGDPLHDFPETRSKAVAKVIKSIPHDGGSRSALGKSRQLACHKNFDGFKDVYGRMAWDNVAPTITGGCVNPSKGRFLHPEANRAITLREAALLQTFPPNYFFSLRRGKYHAASLIGNALPPEFVRQQALQIIQALRSPQED